MTAEPIHSPLLGLLCSERTHLSAAAGRLIGGQGISSCMARLSHPARTHAARAEVVSLALPSAGLPQ